MEATGAAASVLSKPSDRELLFTRTFDAPQARVYEVWTDPKHIVHWWGPHGFTTTVQEMDVRPGGNWRLVMRGPDGRDYKNRIVFVEVVKPEKLVYRHEPEPGTEPVTFETTVTFAKEGEKTRVTMRMIFPSQQERDHVVDTYHADEGGKQHLANLAEYLAGRQSKIAAGGNVGASPNYGEGEVTLTRVFNAPRKLVFQAWTDPKHIAQWWGPKQFTNPVCKIDPRVGGALVIHMRAPDGQVYPMKGEFREFVEPEMIAFTNIAVDQEGKHIIEGFTVVNFTEKDGKTTVTVNTRGTAVVAYAANYLKGMEMGWTMSLEKLAEYLAQA